MQLRVSPVQVSMSIWKASTRTVLAQIGHNKKFSTCTPYIDVCELMCCLYHMFSRSSRWRSPNLDTFENNRARAASLNQRPLFSHWLWWRTRQWNRSWHSSCFIFWKVENGRTTIFTYIIYCSALNNLVLFWICKSNGQWLWFVNIPTDQTFRCSPMMRMMYLKMMKMTHQR